MPDARTHREIDETRWPRITSTSLPPFLRLGSGWFMARCCNFHNSSGSSGSSSSNSYNSRRAYALGMILSALKITMRDHTHPPVRPPARSSVCRTNRYLTVIITCVYSLSVTFFIPPAMPRRPSISRAINPYIYVFTEEICTHWLFAATEIVSTSTSFSSFLFFSLASGWTRLNISFLIIIADVQSGREMRETDEKRIF